jgi:hypothetical protein
MLIVILPVVILLGVVAPLLENDCYDTNQSESVQLALQRFNGTGYIFTKL